MILRNGLAALKLAGADGKALLHDVDVYLEGLNARLQGRERHAAAVDARRRVRRQRDRRPDLRPGRRRRGAPLGVPLDAAQALRRQGRRRLFDDVSEFNDPDSPTTISKTFPYGKTTGPAKGNAVLDAGSFKPTGPKGLGRARPACPALGEQLPDRRREALGHRPPAVRRRARRSATPTPA